MLSPFSSLEFIPEIWQHKEKEKYPAVEKSLTMDSSLKLSTPCDQRPTFFQRVNEHKTPSPHGDAIALDNIMLKPSLSATVLNKLISQK